uniref:E3 SUMO-protein ligase RanBP2 n=1 Tax=Diabrotica virgifera virgifera TaxID=50390 RepID=A0A6P7F5L8_DIAVI
MFKTKSEVDRHVNSCLKKINNETERNLRCFSFAKLYFNVGDYDQAYRYISSYLTVKPKSAEGYQLLGKSLEKLGKVDAALDAFKHSLQIDPKQNNLVIKVCELMSCDNVELDLSGARYFCDLAQSFDPNNSAVRSLRERLITTKDSPYEISQLLLKELEVRPTDIKLRIKLIKHFLQNNMIKEAYKHASAIEEKDIPSFYNNINWYENFAEVLLRFQKDVSLDSEINWDFWFLSVSVLERLVALSIDDRYNISSSVDCVTATFNLDQMLYKASQNISSCPDRNLVSIFLRHYQMQLYFHYSTLLLKQGRKDLIPFKEASNLALPTLFTAYHSTPIDLQSTWFLQSSEQNKKMVQKWYRDSCYRFSQTGHVLLAMAKDKKSIVLEKAAQYSSGMWREQLFKKLFVKREHHLKISSSFFVNNVPPVDPTIKLPDATDLSKFDEISQLSYPNSLHHYIWIMLNGSMADVNIVTFEGLQYSTKNLTSCSAESINLLDIFSFICCATMCASSNLNDNKLSYYVTLPASITANLGTIQQANFIESAYKMYKNEACSQLGDIRALLIKGIEVVRCIGHHGLDIKILVQLANIFEERSKKLTKQSEIDFNIARAELYWKTALPLLEKVKNDQKIAYTNNRLFQLKSNEVTPCEAKGFIEKGLLFIGTQLMKKKDHDQALAIFEQLKDPYASYHQFEIYKQIADKKINGNKIEGIGSEKKREVTLFLTKARDCLYLTLDRLRGSTVDPKHPINSKIGTELEQVDRLLLDMESDDLFSDVNRSLEMSTSEQYLSSLTHVSHSAYTPKLSTSLLNQSTPMKQSMLRQEARPSPERMDAQIRELMSMKDSIFTLVAEQNRNIAEVQKSLVDKLNSVVDELRSIKKEVETLKDVTKSVNDIKNSIDDFQNVTDAIQEMKKELIDFKKSDTKNQLSDEDLYILDPDYGVDYNIGSTASTFPTAVPGTYPNFPAGRIPNPSHVAAAYGPPVLYPGLYPGLPYGYGGLNLQPGTLPFMQDQQAPSISTSVASHLLTGQSALSQNLGLEALSGQILTQTAPPPFMRELPKDLSGTTTHTPKITPAPSIFGKAPPVNVVITTSDPLPAQNTLTNQPVLSVTIPPQHIKGNFLKPDATANPPELEPPTFSLTPKLSISGLNKTLNESNASNASATEDFEPNVNFKPLIPLPDEVPVKTGEEGETELFCARAELFRHSVIGDVKEWKQRGIGNIKIVKNPITNKYRVVMRRDQVLKICANHYITADMVLKEIPTNNRSLMWAAQDFSEGEIAKETFLVKFKLAEDAKKFSEVFEAAKKSSKSTKVETIDLTKKETPKSASSTTSLGGFVFTGTPTFLPKDVVTATPVAEVKEASKPVTPFSTFVFGKTEAKAEPIKFTPLVITQEKEKDDRSSPVEEFVPTAEFKPLIPLPELVEIKTGEENCEILFEERAKLFRLDSSGETKEWKERGVGVMKILKDESVRLLMRRDQVHKVCCNHRILKDMIFKMNSKNPKAVIWSAQDFSEGELQKEMFTIRFKTAEIASKFLETIQKEQCNLNESGNFSVKENVDFAKNQAISAPAASKVEPVGFGDKFKAKAGSWECNTCMIRNDASASACVACNTSRTPATGQNVEEKKTVTFNFLTNAQPATKTTPVMGFGDKFKPKPGSWECKTCMIKNEGKDSKCVACETPREGVLKQTIKPDVKTAVPEQKFVFGIPNTAPINLSGQNKPSIIPDINAAANTPEQKWTFGISKTTPTPITFGKDATPTTPITFGKDATPATPITFGKDAAPAAGAKSTPATANQNSFSFISPTKQEFEFKQRPPRRVSQGHDAESDADGSYVEEEEDNIYFKPVVPLPEKVQVKTGEEDEDVLYSHRAKLFRYIGGEWKERGLGDIKILRNRFFGKLRVVMRREQVFKICLNHTLTKDIEYLDKDEKSIMFAAADFSEGEIVNEKFCVRFKNAEIAADFKKAIRDALDGKPTEDELTSKKTEEDVVVISETQVTPEEEQEAIKLGLPPKFMSYKQLPDCKCEQCKKDDEYLKALFATEAPKKIDSSATPSSKFSSYTTPKLRQPKAMTKEASPSPNKSGSLIKPAILTPPSTNQTLSNVSLPAASSTNIFSSSNNSFNTGGLFSSTNLFGGETPNKENTTVFNKNIATDVKTTPVSSSAFSSGSSIFSFDSQQPFKPFGSNVSNIFGQTTPSTTSSSVFSQTPTTTSNIFAQNTPTTNFFGQNTPTTNLFGQNTPTATPLGQATPTTVFGTVSTNTTSSIFGQNTLTNTTSNLFSQNTPTTTVNIFGPKNPPQTTSMLFGQSTPTTSTNIFGANAASNVFGQTSTSGSIFGNKTFNVAEDKSQTAGFLFGNGATPAVSTSNVAPKVPSTTGLKETDEVVLKCNSDLSFGSLAKTSLNAEPQFKKDESFSFLGTGAPVFKNVKKAADTSKGESDDENNTSNANEEYDPHYEPIIPLPEAITVTTGEENEAVVFNERAKLFRFDADTKEWKERGVGQLKVLWHQEKNTYRLVLRREQVLKVVLNQLITPNFELQPMATSDKAWIWAGYNYTEDEHCFEKLAVRFRTQETAAKFSDAIRDVLYSIANSPNKSGDLPVTVEDFGNDRSRDSETQEDPLDPDNEENDDEYKYDDDDEYVEDEEYERTMFSKECTLSELGPDNQWKPVGTGYIQIFYDPNIFAARIIFNDENEANLSSTMIGTNSKLEVENNECTWTAVEWAGGVGDSWRTLKATFDSEASAAEFQLTYEEGYSFAVDVSFVDKIPED